MPASKPKRNAFSEADVAERKPDADRGLRREAEKRAPKEVNRLDQERINLHKGEVSANLEAALERQKAEATALKETWPPRVPDQKMVPKYPEVESKDFSPRDPVVSKNIDHQRRIPREETAVRKPEPDPDPPRPTSPPAISPKPAVPVEKEPSPQLHTPQVLPKSPPAPVKPPDLPKSGMNRTYGMPRPMESARVNPPQPQASEHKPSAENLSGGTSKTLNQGLPESLPRQAKDAHMADSRLDSTRVKAAELNLAPEKRKAALEQAGNLKSSEVTLKDVSTPTKTAAPALPGEGGTPKNNNAATAMTDRPWTERVKPSAKSDCETRFRARIPEPELSKEAAVRDVKQRGEQMQIKTAAGRARRGLRKPPNPVKTPPKGKGR